MTGTRKILIIRFSSLGDIFQALPTVPTLKRHWPNCEVHWLVRSDFGSLLKNYTSIDHLIIFSREEGLWGLLKLARDLKAQNYTHVYDAHNNLRSRILCWILCGWIFSKRSFSFVRRPKFRWKRFLLFKFRINKLPSPFRAATSFLQPLKKWGIHPDTQFFTKNQSLGVNKTAHRPNEPYICLAPSAAWEMKRWPKRHWIELATHLKAFPLVILGGPDDNFCNEIATQAQHKQIVNLAGQISWNETADLVEHARLVISNDTGVLHMADFSGTPCLGIIGPTAFGYPFRPSSKVIEKQLWCKPCTKDGRGRCVNPTYKKCLIDISPQDVFQEAKKELGL